jgi:hypothetical protein
MNATFQYEKRGLLQRGRVGQRWTLKFDTYLDMWTFLHNDAIIRDNISGLRRDDGSRIFGWGKELNYEVHSTDWRKWVVVLKCVRDPFEGMK